VRSVPHENLEAAVTDAHIHTHTDIDAERELQEFRAEKDEVFRTDPYSPLTEEQKGSFTGLSYYPPNDALRLELALETDVDHSPVTMEVSTGGSREYRRAGKIRFEVGGQPGELTVFASDDQLFLPVRDATSTTETYPAGRYLEPEPIDDGRVLVDFNYLYNPYCAYNERWSCPIPPVENWLRVPLEAGEKRFH
jgi:uncharacterized protein (DUF1684 family)